MPAFTFYRVSLFRYSFVLWGCSDIFLSRRGAIFGPSSDHATSRQATVLIRDQLSEDAK